MCAQRRSFIKILLMRVNYFGLSLEQPEKICPFMHLKINEVETLNALYRTSEMALPTGNALVVEA